MADETLRPRGLPMCVVGLHGDGPRLAAWPIVALLALALVVTLSLKGALIAPDGDTPPAMFTAAIADLERTVAGLTPEGQRAAGAPVRLLLEHGEATRVSLDAHGVPLVDAASTRDLVFAADAVRTLAEELRAAGEGDAGAAAATIDVLARATLVRLRQVDQRLVEEARQGGKVIVRVEDWGDRWRVWRADPAQRDLVRALGIALLLGGCLVVGSRLLGRRDPTPAPRDLVATPAAVVGLAALAVFLAGSIGLVVRPSALPGFAADVTSLPRPGPCSRLEVARDVYRASEAIGAESLTERVRARVQARAQACLGLESRVAVREATERLLATVQRAEDAHPALDPAAVPRSVSLALMPDVPQDLAHLQTSIDALLQEVEGLRAERAARAPDPSLGTGGPEIPMAHVLADPHQGEGASPPAVAEPAPGPIEDRVDPPVPGANGPRPFVTTTVVNYRNGPSQDAAKLGTLQKGTRVRLVSDDAGWASVRLHDGRAVYVASAFLTPIE